MYIVSYNIICGDYLIKHDSLYYFFFFFNRLKAEGERGDVAKSIQCYMEEKGVSEEEAQDYIKGLISYSWKKMNQESAKPSIPKSIVNMCLNMARTAHCIFEHGDGIGNSIGVTKDRLISLIANPIPLR